MYVCTVWVSETKQKRSTAQVNNPIYHVQEPIVLYNDTVWLSLFNISLAAAVHLSATTHFLVSYGSLTVL